MTWAFFFFFFFCKIWHVSEKNATDGHYNARLRIIVGLFHNIPGNIENKEICDVLTLLLPFSNIILRLFIGKAGFSTGEVGENGSDAVSISSFSSAHFFCLVSMSAFVFAGLSWDVGSWLRLACRTGLLEEAGGSGGLLGLQEAD